VLDFAYWFCDFVYIAFILAMQGSANMIILPLLLLDLLSKLMDQTLEGCWVIKISETHNMSLKIFRIYAENNRILFDNI